MGVADRRAVGQEVGVLELGAEQDACEAGPQLAEGGAGRNEDLVARVDLETDGGAIGRG
jgi:hypothetical protein